MNKKIKAMATFTGFAATLLHLWNKFEYSRCTFQNILSEKKENKGSFYDWRFGKVIYTKSGNGSPLLLIHDLIAGSSSYEYHKIVKELSKEYEVYCIDLLGYGKSDKPDITYTNYLYVQLISDFIKNVIGRKTNIIACGDTVPVAIMACHNDNEIINKIIAINPTSLFDLSQIPSKRSRLKKFILDTPIVGTFIYNRYTNKQALTKAFQEKLFYDVTKIEEQDIFAYMEAAHTGGYNAKYSYASYIGHYMNANIVHALKEINNSIIIIASDKKEDNHTIVANYEYYNPSIESVFIARSKHLIQLERPDILLKHLNTYL